jgi:hypothetical protein
MLKGVFFGLKRHFCIGTRFEISTQAVCPEMLQCELNLSYFPVAVRVGEGIKSGY